jgi:beta-glucosidase
MSFPRDFIFGSATSAYQIEGAADEDGRLPSWWDTFCQGKDNIRDGSSGAVACDHYHRWEADLDLMRGLGLDAYRFSIAWPRVLPRGSGRVNAAGLDFYERLVDGVLARGMLPYATLYHWDLPQTLADRGGWLNRDTCQAFGEFCAAAANRLGDRVHSWATLNEPRCAAVVGYYEGRHAPGISDRRSSLQAAHHLLLAHGTGLPVLRQLAPRGKAGIVLDIKPYYPARDTPADRAAAIRGDGLFNRWFFDPVCLGRYPADIWRDFGDLVPEVEAGDLALISAPVDHIGLNYYTRGHVADAPDRPYPSAAETPVPGAVYTTMDWEIFPEGLRAMLVRLRRDYPGVPVFWIAENGAALDDAVSPDGAVHDSVRTGYYQGHLEAVEAARADGVPIDAYFAWSLMDNFEWGRGYTQRFGIVHVDYATQKRTPKDSALWLRDFIARQRQA